MKKSTHGSVSAEKGGLEGSPTSIDAFQTSGTSPTKQDEADFFVEMSTRSVRIGQRILHLRESRMMTRPQLARRSEVSRSHLWHIEQGHMIPGLGTLEKISEALNVGLIRFFIPDSGEEVLEDSFIQSVRPFVRRLDCEQRQLLLKTLQAAPRNSKGMRLENGND